MPPSNDDPAAEPWPGFSAMKRAFENAPSCHHLSCAVERKFADDVERWLEKRTGT
jgi:hypothetical protein